MDIMLVHEEILWALEVADALELVHFPLKVHLLVVQQCWIVCLKEGQCEKSSPFC